MQPPHDSTSLRQTLYRLEDVCVELPDDSRLGPITWTLARGQRIGVRCAREAQWQGLVGLLTGERKPAQGRLEELRTVTVQTDARLREALNPNGTLEAFLRSPDAPEMVWIEGRRRALRVLVDALGISPAMTRRPLKLLGRAEQHKVWVLRFLLSQAELVLGREIFRSDDAQVQTALRRRWGDLPGALVAAVPHDAPDGDLPGPVHAWVHLDAAGHFSLEPVPAEPQTPPDDAAR